MGTEIRQDSWIVEKEVMLSITCINKSRAKRNELFSLKYKRVQAVERIFKLDFLEERISREKFSYYTHDVFYHEESYFLESYHELDLTLFNLNKYLEGYRISIMSVKSYLFWLVLSKCFVLII